MNRILLICHYTGKTGGLENLKKILHSKRMKTLELLHPLDNYEAVPTKFTDAHGNVTEKKRTNRGLFNYVEDLVLSIRTIQRNEIDTIIGCSNFDTAPAIFCRIVLRKKIKNLIYYPRDYSEDRFKNKLMNHIYTGIESFVCKYADLTISNTRRAEQKRIKLGLPQQKSVVVPNPIFIDQFDYRQKEIEKDSFIYVGDVSREHGLYDLVKTLTPYIKKLTIIGSGNDWERTVEYASKQSFELEIHHAKKREFVIDYLREFKGVGLAPYNLHSKWTYYCSPLKVSEYIVNGVPVLMSDVPECSEIIKKKGYGITYDKLDFHVIVDKLKQFNTLNFHKKAKAYYSANNADTLYSGIL